jgi:hypothetical protein
MTIYLNNSYQIKKIETIRIKKRSVKSHMEITLNLAKSFSSNYKIERV